MTDKIAHSANSEPVRSPSEVYADFLRAHRATVRSQIRAMGMNKAQTLYAIQDFERGAVIAELILTACALDCSVCGGDRPHFSLGALHFLASVAAEHNSRRRQPSM